MNFIKHTYINLQYPTIPLIVIFLNPVKTGSEGSKNDPTVSIEDKFRASFTKRGILIVNLISTNFNQVAESMQFESPWISCAQSLYLSQHFPKRDYFPIRILSFEDK